MRVVDNMPKSFNAWQNTGKKSAVFSSATIMNLFPIIGN